MENFSYSMTTPRSRGSRTLSPEPPQHPLRWLVSKTPNTFSAIATYSTTSSIQDRWAINLSKKELTPEKSLHYRKAKNLQLPQQLSLSQNISPLLHFTNVYKIPTEKFIALLEFTITKWIFCFNKKFYKQ